MKIIDLTLPIYTGMPVFPGDPEASLEIIQTIEKDGWNMRRIQINSHDGSRKRSFGGWDNFFRAAHKS